MDKGFNAKKIAELSFANFSEIIISEIGEGFTEKQRTAVIREIDKFANKIYKKWEKQI